MRQGSTTRQARIPSPEGVAPPPAPYTSWDAYMADVERQAPYWDRVQALRVTKAMRLATSPTVFAALLDEQPVPVDRLDPEWRARYGL